MNAIHRAVAVLLAVLLAGCAGASRVQHRLSERGAAYEAAAGTPVRGFRFVNLYSWEALDDRHAAIYTRPDQAWLLDFDSACPGLETAEGIALTSFGNEVSAGFDQVIARHPPVPCRISQIRPVDTARLKKLQKKQLEIRSAPRPGRHAPGPAPAASS